MYIAFSLLIEGHIYGEMTMKTTTLLYSFNTSLVNYSLG